MRKFTILPDVLPGAKRDDDAAPTADFHEFNAAQSSANDVEEVINAPVERTIETPRYVSPYRAAKQSGPPTRERKLKAISPQQLAAARALVKPQPPIKPGPTIRFEPDHTPADAEEQLSRIAAAAPRVNRIAVDGPPVSKRPGPLPSSAPAEAKAKRDQINAARMEISPYPPMTPEALRASQQSHASPELSEAELQQIIQLAQAKYGPILDLKQASELSRRAMQTLREKVSKGYLEHP